MHVLQVLREYDGLQQLLVRLRLLLVRGCLLGPILLFFLLDYWHFQYTSAVRAQLMVHVQHLLYDGPEFLRIGFGYAHDLACAHTLK